MTQIQHKYIALDEEGFLLSGDLRLNDPVFGREVLQNIKYAENGSWESTYQGQTYVIEAFDEPYVAQAVNKNGKVWSINLPYEFSEEFSIQSLSLDEWDRFHGLTKTKKPFVLSRRAQVQFFNLIDDSDDDSITVDGKRMDVPAYWQSESKVETDQFWTEIYQNEKPGWDLEQPAPALIDMLPRLKLSKSRVLVLGSGPGHDAAYFAKAGHVVTAVDFSAEAIAKSKALYGDLRNLEFVQADIFNLPLDMQNSYDIIFEHTCFCAINPTLRSRLVSIWKNLLVEGGFLMGIFFVNEKRKGPPYGASEWEIRERLRKSFQFVFWGRLKNSIDRRYGKELLIYAQKK